MAQNGMFRNAFRGFHKQDVLQYIDEITAAWDEERKALEQQAHDAETAQVAAQAAADEAAAQATAAVEQRQVAETQLAEVQQQLFDTTADLTVAATTIEEMATQLEEAQRRLAQLEQELAATADERDAAIAALADAKNQLADVDTLRRQLEDSRRVVNSQNEQMTAMRQTIQRYESVLGNVDAMQEQMGSQIRPCIQQTAATADAALENTQNFLTDLIGQLDEIRSHMSGTRSDLQQTAIDGDARLSAILDRWLATGQGNGGSFFQ